MCTELLPPGGYPIAVKYIISYHLKFILFWNNTLHVSDSLSVHRQDSKTVHTASGICHTGSVADIQAYLMLYVQS